MSAAKMNETPETLVLGAGLRLACAMELAERAPVHHHQRDEQIGGLAKTTIREGDDVF